MLSTSNPFCYFLSPYFPDLGFLVLVVTSFSYINEIKYKFSVLKVSLIFFTLLVILCFYFHLTIYEVYKIKIDAMKTQAIVSSSNFRISETNPRNH